MDGSEQAVQAGFFGLSLWLKCGLAGTAVGAAVAMAQVFPGRWHPAWAQRLLYWFSCPLFAGLATGVVIALRGVPPLASARTFWLILCLVIGGVTSTAAAAAVAVGQWLLARRRFERRIRMTPEEFAEEQKEMQADPRIKLLNQRRGPRAQQAGTS